jgi:surface carbohydrate biosynthesis protein
MKKISILLSYLIKGKWKLFPPKPKKILIYDGMLNPFNNYFKKKDYNIYFRRGEELNIFLIFLCLIELKLTTKNYLRKYLFYSKPKIIITAIDNNHGFYSIANEYNITTMFVQNGIRTLWGDIFSQKKIANRRNKKKYKVDFMFVFNDTIAKKYSSFIQGKTIPIGSFKNNILKFKKVNKKKEILFISTHKAFRDKLKTGKINDSFFFKNDKKIINFLSKRASLKKIKFNVLGRGLDNDSEIEKNFFNANCNNKLNFIKNFRGRDTYSIVNQYEYVMTIDSTLGIENFTKSHKTGFFFNRPYKFPIYTRRFGDMEKLKRKGPNWTSSEETKEFKRVFDFIINSKEKSWKNLRKKYAKKSMEYDYLNKKFLSIINNII